MSNRLVMWTSAVCIAIALWTFYWLASYTTRGGEQAPLYSVRRYDPYGAAALYELLKQRGANVSTLEQSRIVDETTPSVMIQILDSSAAYRESKSPFEASTTSRLNPEHLQEWMRKGNTVIQFCAFRTELMRICGVTHMAVDGGHQDVWKNIETDMRSGVVPEDLGWTSTAVWLEGGGNELFPNFDKQMTMHFPRQLSHEATGTWTPLARADTSAAVMGIKKVGDGKLVIVSSPTPVLNHWLGDEGNLEVLLALFDGVPGGETKRILIDEWSHGFGHGGTIIALIARLGLLPALAQAALVLVLFIWGTRGVRAVPVEHQARRRSSVEQVATLGNLYGQVLRPNDLRRRTHREVRRRIATALGCPVSGIEKRLTQYDEEVQRRANQLLQAADSGQGGVVLTAEPHVRCHRCGYNLFGNASGTCPECGNRISGLDHHIQRADSTSEDDALSNKRMENQMRELLTKTFEFTRELNH